MTRIALTVSIVAAALNFCGCTAYFMTKTFDGMQKEALIDSVDVNVYQPGLLAAAQRVAVLDFRVINMVGMEGVVDVFKGTIGEGTCWFPKDVAGMLLAECCEERLLKHGTFEVVERNQLAAVLKEKGMELSGLVEAQNTGPIAGLPNVDAIILGTLANGYFYMPNNPALPQFFRGGVRLRMIDLKTGKIILTMRDKVFVSGNVDEEEALYTIAERSAAALAGARPRK